MKRRLLSVSSGVKSRVDKHRGRCLSLVISGVGVGTLVKEFHPIGWVLIITASLVMWGMVFTTR